MGDKSSTGEFPVFFLLKTLLFSYILTGVLLAFLAVLLYKLRLDEKAVALAIIVIYVIGTFFEGFVAGRRLKNRKFLWGLLLGMAYFAVLALVSLVVGRGHIQLGNSFLTTLVLCAGGGMLGGMLS